jgi:acyl-CoA synthetase (AMP-forming)/AMP-acid ligase II
MLVHEIPALAAANAHADAAIHGDDGRTLSYAAFAAECTRLARAVAASVSRGARVAVLAGNRIDYLAAYFAVPAAGALLVPLNIRLGPQDLGQVLADAEPSLVLVEAALLPLLRSALAGQALQVVAYDADVDTPAVRRYADWLDAAPEDTALPADLHDDDPAWLLFTSGTTGRAKGAVLSHRNLVAGTLNTLCTFEMGRDEVALFLFPMFHIAGYALLAYLLRGYTIVLMRGFEVEAYLAAVQRHRITLHAIAPTMLAMVLNHPQLDAYDTSSLRQMVYGASAMPAEVIRAAMARWPGVGFGTAFGMTELAGNVLYLPREQHLRGLQGDAEALAACGLPMPLASVRLLDDDGRDVSDGQPGELAVRGDQVFAGYWRNPQATREAFRDGWFLSGDIGRRDAAGRMHIVDRKKDMVLSGGENVYSREVEALLYQHPAVHEVAVVGAPHATWGEQVVALLSLKPEANAADPVALFAALDAHCKTRIAGYKRPRAYALLDTLPKSAAGKILKAELRRQLRDGRFTLTPPA